jgi:glycosyltransferase involved in cell wall biosynthesis
LIVVGSGSQESWLKNQIETRSIGNIDLVGRYPAHEMPQFFTRAEGLLVTLKREDVFSFTIPGKVQAYLAAGRPVIAALDGEGAEVIVDAKAGFTCPAEDGAALAEKIERLYYCSIEERLAMAVAARSYYLNNFEMECQAKCLIEILKNRINLTQAE